MKYNGVYNKRVIGLYKGKCVVYYDTKNGYRIADPYVRKPTIQELKEIKTQFGDLEKEIIKND